MSMPVRMWVNIELSLIGRTPMRKPNSTNVATNSDSRRGDGSRPLTRSAVGLRPSLNVLLPEDPGDLWSLLGGGRFGFVGVGRGGGRLGAGGGLGRGCGGLGRGRGGGRLLPG